MAWSEKKKQQTDWQKYLKHKGAGGFGLQDIASALKEGASWNDIKWLHNKAKHIANKDSSFKVGPAVESYINYDFSEGFKTSQNKPGLVGLADVNHFNTKFKTPGKGELKTLLGGLLRDDTGKVKKVGSQVKDQVNLAKNTLNATAKSYQKREEKIVKAYQKHLGRYPDVDGLRSYAYNSKLSENDIEKSISGSKEAKNRAISTKVIAAKSEGATDKWFGPASYKKLLNDAWKSGGVKAVRTVRNTLLTWLKSPSKEKDSTGKFKTNAQVHLSSANQLTKQEGGKTVPNKTGLYWNMAQNNHKSTYFGNYATDKGGSKTAGDEISIADIRAMQASGLEDFEIYKFMKSKPDAWKTQNQKDAFNDLRSSLIAVADKDISDNGVKFENTMKHPLWIETAEHYGTLPKGWEGMNNEQIRRRWEFRQTMTWNKDKNKWEKGSKHKGIRSWKKDSEWYSTKTSIVGNAFDSVQVMLDRTFGDKKDNWKNLRTQEQFATFTGTGGGGYQIKGEYWKQWGASGPKDSKGDLDLKMVQLIAAEDLVSDTDDSQKILDYMEKEFTNKLWKESKSHVDGGGKSQVSTTSAGWDTAKDSWGLDIRRIDSNGNSLEAYKGKDLNKFKDYLKTDSGSKWWETLAYGGTETIDWAFYRTDSKYKAAQEAIGTDDSLDTIREIRRANIWIHGGGDGQVSTTYKAYQPKFRIKDDNPEKPQKWNETTKKWEDMDPYKVTQQENIPSKKDLLKSALGRDKLTETGEALDDLGTITVNVPPFSVTQPESVPTTWKTRE